MVFFKQYAFHDNHSQRRIYIHEGSIGFADNIATHNPVAFCRQFLLFTLSTASPAVLTSAAIAALLAASIAAPLHACA